MGKVKHTEADIARAYALDRQEGEKTAELFRAFSRAGGLKENESLAIIDADGEVRAILGTNKP